ncbi:hypothetical protein A5707_12740 [Mycobacterium kyorinense]|uniref:S-adenosyl-L-methionine-dependent methyltransferase n=1 Tax=Mycobacterium kyorinense TaxID=487514 RepID=A0A1A2ZP22_9MYCO|nr:SAM-dependent methyltransferase [Mycobacterium kyorinense]OBI52055.1 hypothetical protein A5707_12740 [Mycobacterium kyorinense]
MTRRALKARSADAPMLFPALEMHYPRGQRVSDDEFAIRMLSPGLRMAAHAMAWQPLRGLLARSVDKQMPGFWGGVVARKRYADEQVVDALSAGIKQFVILGAGFDTRAFRLIARAGADAFEVDLPENSARKKALIERLFGGVPASIELVAVNLETGDLENSLVTQGFQSNQPTMYVIEAVTPYLSHDAIARVFAVLAKAPTSSRLVFTYILREFLEGKQLYGWDKAYQRWVVKEGIYRFGLSPAGVGDFLRQYGWTECEQVGSAEYRARYFEPAGRDLTGIDVERFVAAQKA